MNLFLQRHPKQRVNAFQRVLVFSSTMGVLSRETTVVKAPMPPIDAHELDQIKHFFLGHVHGSHEH